MTKRLIAHLGLAIVALAGCGGGKSNDTKTPPPTESTPDGAQLVARVVDGDTGEPIPGISVGTYDQRGLPLGTPGLTDVDGRFPLPPNAGGVVAPQPEKYLQAAIGIAPGRTGEVTLRLYNPALQSAEYGGGPERTRYIPAVDLPVPAGKPTWEYTGKSLLEFPPAVANGIAVLTNNSGRIIAFDAKKGTTKWNKKHTDSNYIAASPAIIPSDSRVLVAGMDGRLVAYDLSSGVVKWEFTTGGSPIESSPLVFQDTVYLGAHSGRLYAVSKANGKLRWSFIASGDIKGSVAKSGDLIIFGDYSGTLYAVNTSGTLVWRKKLGERFYGGPAISEGRGVIGDVGGAVIAFDPTNGRQLWRRPVGNYVYSSPAIANGTVFIGSYTGDFEALDLRTGDVKWSFAAGGRIGGSATVVGNTVYVSTLARRGEPDRTYGLDVRNGAVRWRGKDGRYSPAVAAGRTLFIVGRTSLYAYHTP
jgi:outer membrane protein assembly factor BamB